LSCATAASAGTCPNQTDPNLLANVTYSNVDDRATFREYNGVSDTYAYDTGTARLDKINHASQSTNYSSDGAGRRTLDDNTSLSNDTRNYYYRADGRLRLVTGKRPSKSPNYSDYQVAYSYDWKGRRIFKSDKNLSTGVTHQWWFFYDQDDRMIGVRDIPNASSPTTYNVQILYYLDDERVMRFLLKYVNGSFNSEQRDVFHGDHLQTPMAVERWNPSGPETIVWSADYVPWGYARILGGATAVVDHRFQGQWYDGETEVRTWHSGVAALDRPGLTQNAFRDYDAWSGGFVEFDPLLVFWGTRSLPRRTDPGRAGVQSGPFAYAEPSNSSDPTGLAPVGSAGVFDWLERLGEDILERLAHPVHISSDCELYQEEVIERGFRECPFLCCGYHCAGPTVFIPFTDAHIDLGYNTWNAQPFGRPCPGAITVLGGSVSFDECALGFAL
jgi:hypothetical protein